MITGKLPELLEGEAQWEAQQPPARSGGGGAVDHLELARGFRRRTGVGPLLLDGIATRKMVSAPPAWARSACAEAMTATPSMLSL